MSRRFSTSHQYVGLNRVGKYMEPAREKGPDPSPYPLPQGEGKQQRNEKWRRITNIVGRNIETFTIKQRKRGIRALVSWMEGKLKSELNRRDAEAQRLASGIRKIGVIGEWGCDVERWGGVKHAGRSVESLCVELGITHAKLSGLTKEGFGLSAGEIVDGIKVRGLKDFIVGQLGEAARKLWGMPGSFAEVRCCFADGKYGKNRKNGNYVCREAGDEMRLRLRELIEALNELRDENDFGIQNLALRLGFESAAKFRKACWTVMGRSPEQLERILAHEIVDYYLAAEDRKLREIAMAADGNYGKDGNHVIYAAREIYGSGDDAPEPPFLDRWSANEFAKPDWLRAMQEKFG